MNSTTNPFTRAQITTLVQRFYADIRVDALLGPIFNPVIGNDWDKHLSRLVDFWCTVAVGEKSFRGNVFGKHMALSGIEPAHFLRWLTLWHKHTDLLLDDEQAKSLQSVAHGIARNLFYGFFGEFARFTLQDGEIVVWESDHA